MGVFLKRWLRPELRKAPRHELHFAAYIATGDRLPHRPCIIHDVSEGGARLTIGLRTEFLMILLWSFPASAEWYAASRMTARLLLNFSRPNLDLVASPGRFPNMAG